MKDGKIEILIIMGRYLPGYKDGGPVRSIKNLVDFLGNEFELNILTCDRDHGDEKAYPNIRVNEWNQVGKAKVFYVPPKGFSIFVILKLISKADLVYMCGCFNDYSFKVLLLNRLGLIKKPVVVASMGLFSPMEFHLKYRKKKLFTSVFNVLGVFKYIYWSATSEMEISEIQEQIKAARKQFFIAEDLPRLVDTTPITKEKSIGNLKVAWISRIAPKKNLIGAIKILQQVMNNVEFTIYGPVHVKEYWDECQQELQKLPANVKWIYKGNVESARVVEVLRQHHVFLFLTLGENYGHVIQEALSAGCPCILSDQTPWKDLEEKEVGYVYSLREIKKIATAIDRYAVMNQSQLEKIVANAIKYAGDNSNDKVKNTGYRNVFLLGGGD
jgi:glycosyltransferase involved in cell wall biosynthesis